MRNLKAFIFIGSLLISVCLFLRQHYVATLIKGECMAPMLHNNDWGLIKKIERPDQVRVGDVVLAWDPLNYLVLKRVHKKGYWDDDYYFYLLGDNPSLSDDSRTWGWINGWRIRGILVYPKGDQ